MLIISSQYFFSASAQGMSSLDEWQKYKGASLLPLPSSGIAEGDAGLSDNLVVSAADPEFIIAKNESGILAYGSSSFWKLDASCQFDFKCASDSTTGWRDNSSLQISTRAGSGNWSWIASNEIPGLKSGEVYEITVHMKLNENVLQSHVGVEAYIEPSQRWQQIGHCPTGLDGPLKWSTYSCKITVPQGVSKIRLLLNAGWSTSPDREAVTWYDAISIKSSSHPAPALYDKSLKLEVVQDGLLQPTTMTFLGKEDYLVLQSGNGTVERFVNGTKLQEPLIDLNVSRYNGALGIAALKPNLSQQMNDMQEGIEAYVFIYYDESGLGRDCGCPANGSRLYRFELVDNGTKLVNPKLFISLPIGNTFPVMHEGGPIKIGPDGNVYLIAGDVRSVPEGGEVVKNKAINYEDGDEPDGRAGILRFNPDGKPVDEKGILGDHYPLSLYYAYGVRNSFGFAFDPLSGKMWDTENGPNYGDEVNLVEPGFNSGWAAVMGFEQVADEVVFSNSIIPDKVVNFEGKGVYSDPEFVWRYPVGPTALTFLASNKFGEHENDLLVADYQGNIYHFSLNDNRTELTLNGSLVDRIADDQQESNRIKFGEGFGIITDMQIGPDGDLYIVSYKDLGSIQSGPSDTSGKIYRVTSSSG
jgi:glucose/arabinose dehydrogenase